MSERNSPDPRANQRYRTRRELLDAAARLMREGDVPTMAEVAEEAMVSRATAYRYFPSRDALLAEAPIQGLVPTPEMVLTDEAGNDPEERLDRAEAALHEMVFANETQIRAFLSASLLADASDGAVPRRQNRRVPLIEAALKPLRSQVDTETYSNLVAALAVFFGIESMIVFRDVLDLSPAQARRVKSWAIRTLVRAARSSE